MPKHKSSKYTTPVPALRCQSAETALTGRPPSTIPRALLSDLCSTVEMLSSLHRQLRVTAPNTAEWNRMAEGLGTVLSLFDAQIARALKAMQGVRLDTPEKSAVWGALQSLVTCSDTLGAPDLQQEAVGGCVQAVILAGNALRSAVDSVPADYLLEGLEHRPAPPWRPDPDVSHPAPGRQGRRERDDELYAAAEQMLQEQPRPSHTEVLNRLRQLFPTHPFFKSKSRERQHAAFRAGLSKRRHKRTP
jgi:hypothetical protein